MKLRKDWEESVVICTERCEESGDCFGEKQIQKARKEYDYEYFDTVFWHFDIILYFFFYNWIFGV